MNDPSHVPPASGPDAAAARARMRELALAASQGERYWRATTDTVPACVPPWFSYMRLGAKGGTRLFVADAGLVADMEFVAACDPGTVLFLLARIDALEAHNALLRAVAQEACNVSNPHEPSRLMNALADANEAGAFP